MNARGHYGYPSSTVGGGARVGSSLLHVLELKQRYENARTDAVAVLLRDLSSDGMVSSSDTNRWEVAQRDGTWVKLQWYPSSGILDVSISDRQPWSSSQVAAVGRRYQAILGRITPLLQSYQAAVVGSALYGPATYVGQQAQPQPRFAARTRAVKAVFDMYTHARAPYYLYAEVNGMIDKRPAASLDEANAVFAALERSPGEVYAAIFDPTDPIWPGPAYDVYHAAPQVPQAPIVGSQGRGARPRVGITLYHSVGDRADAVKQMDIDWNALYQSLASQVGAVTDPMAGVSTGPAQRAREEELAAYKVTDSFAPLYNEVERIGKLLVAAGIDKKTVERWREYVDPPYAEIVAYAAGNAEPLKQQFLAAKKALDDFMPRAQRIAANKRAQEATERRSQAVAQSFDPKKVAWWKSYAAPLFKQWHRFKLDQLGGDRTVADDYISFAERFQTNWDVYEDWKKKLDALRADAEKRGFTINAPAATALATTVWADAGTAIEHGAGAVGSGIGDVWNTLKYGVWGVLGIGALVAISSVVSNLKTGKDPAEKYVQMIRASRGSRGRGSRALPPPSQLALPEGG